MRGAASLIGSERTGLRFRARVVVTPACQDVNMCSVCERSGSGGSLHGPGGVAQLVERLRGTQEDSWVQVPSPPLLPGFVRFLRTLGYTLAGVVAGEGTFVVTRNTPAHFADGTPRLRFVFQISMAERDVHLLRGLRDVLGFGSIRITPPAREHWQPIATYSVASRRAHHMATIPSFDRFLLPSAKRVQFELWRDALRSYDSLRPSRYGKGPSRCSIPGCEKLVRGRMLCRSHYYRATGY